MSLAALHRLTNPLWLNFKGIEITIIDHEGKPWVTAKDAGRCLGYDDPNGAIQRLYNRNRDQFGSDETALIEVEVEYGEQKMGGQSDPPSLKENQKMRGQPGPSSLPKLQAMRKMKVRVFSLRGLNRLGIYARTPIGNEFHNWILDMIEGRSSARTLANDHTRMLRWFFEARPRWKKIHNLFMGHTCSFEEIGRRVEVTASSARRAVNLMHVRGAISDRDHASGMEDARDMIGFWREAAQKRDARQLTLDY